MTDPIDRNTVDIVNGFIPNALRTLSPAWHGDMVALAQFKGRINGAIDAINKLDQLKKTLFYGRDNNLLASGQGDCMGLPDSVATDVGNAANIIHGILGKVTEAGELLEALRASYNGRDALDRVNVIEEIGDGFWYDAILLDEMKSSFPDAMARVINKLRARFPDKFTAENANVRNLENERAILENATGAGSYSDPAEPEPTLAEIVERIVDGSFYDDYDLACRSLPVLRQAVVETNGGDYAPTMAAPMISPAEPASGKQAVERADAAAAQAFANVGNVDPLSHYVESALERSGESHKGIGERSTPMPGEHLSRQLVRKSDIEKN